MPFRSPDLNTLAADLADCLRQLTDFTCVTEHNPRQGTSGNATATSFAWGTLRTNLLGLSATVANVNRIQDFLDRCPTLRYRGTP